MPPGWGSRTRPRILARDGYACRLCGAPARVVDHIDRHGGESDANLQALCQPCSDAKTQQEAAEARRGLTPRAGSNHQEAPPQGPAPPGY